MIHVLIFPFVSATVKVTELVPISAQVNVFGVTLITPETPQASDTDPNTMAGVTVAVPDPFMFATAALQLTVGGVLSITVT